MNRPIPDNFDDERDLAVVGRLSRLRTMPVDTKRLERLLEGKIPPAPGQNRPMRLRWLRPLRAIAASLLVMALIGALVWTTSGGPVMASAAEMARLHRDMVSGRVAVMKVDSIAQAGKLLSGKWPDQPGLPQAPDTHLMACCMQSVKDRKVACLLFNSDGQAVTVSVARSSELRLPQSPTMQRNGQAYHVEQSGELNMVSTQRDGRWICLIGELPVDQLIEIAHGLRFQ